MNLPTFFRPVALLAAAALALAAAGCGDDASARKTSDVRRTIDANGPARFLGAADLQRQLGNRFRAGLYRLAVLTQTTEDAADLGQSLPTGVVDATTCRPTGPGSATVRPWSCTVRWTTVDEQPRVTRYRVGVTRPGCFLATAHPHLRAVHDATIHAETEHPLGFLASTVKGC